MGAFSDDIVTKLLNATLRNTAYSQPATVYLALYTANPTSADSGTEVSGGSYARQSVAFASPSGGSTSNTGTLTFPQASGSWGTITHFGIRDALTTGNLMYFGALAVSKTVSSGDTVQVAISALSISLS